MNAYELADYVADNGYIGTGTTHEVANMLRQQADLIRNLQKSLGFKNSGYETINLTPQTKPLSDEEIEKVFDNTFKVRDFEEAFLKFARAIEERHGIK